MPEPSTQSVQLIASRLSNERMIAQRFFRITGEHPNKIRSQHIPPITHGGRVPNLLDSLVLVHDG
jgi:hypothetical protein